MILYRIAKCVYADNLSGEGSRLYGGRWNSEGRPTIYFASSRSLAVLEVLVHLQPLMIPNDFCLVEVQVPDNSISQVLVDDLPGNWQDVSPPGILKQIGNNFLENKKHLMLKVPSTIVPMEYNYLINVLHPDMKKVKVLRKEPFDFDSRLVISH